MELTIAASPELREVITQAIRTEVAKLTIAPVKPLMTIQETLEYFDISQTTLGTWRDKGLQTYRCGNKIYFKYEDVLDFLSYEYE